LYDRPNGTSPVEEFIEDQSPKNQARIFGELDDMAEFGLMDRGNKLKHLEGKLWELRFRGIGHQFRFVYFAHTGRRIVILHGFSKKSRKTPNRELKTARRRLQDYLEAWPKSAIWRMVHTACCSQPKATYNIWYPVSAAVGFSARPLDRHSE